MNENKTKWQRWKEVIKNPKQGLKDVKGGMKDMTPSQILHGKLIGTYGTIIGTIIAGTVMAINGIWYFLIVLAFAIVIQYYNLIGLSQQYTNAKKMQEELNIMEMQNTKQGYSELDGNQQEDINKEVQNVNAK